MTRADVTADTPIPVSVEGFPLVTTGRVVPSGNNPFVVARTPAGVVEGRYSWAAVVEALTTRGVRLPLPNHCPPPATPGGDCLTFSDTERPRERGRRKGVTA